MKFGQIGSDGVIRSIAYVGLLEVIFGGIFIVHCILVATMVVLVFHINRIPQYPAFNN